MNEQKKQIIDLVNKIKYEVTERQMAELAGCATPLSEAEFVDWHGKIDNLDLTREVGGKMVPVGRRIMAFAREMVRRFPMTSKVLVILAVLAFVVAHIPYVGWLLQPIVFGVGMVIAGLIFLNESLRNASLNGIN